MVNAALLLPRAEACPRPLAHVRERPFSGPAPPPMPVLRGEHLLDVAELKLDFALRRACGLPVEQLGVAVAVKVPCEQGERDQNER